MGTGWMYSAVLLRVTVTSSRKIWLTDCRMPGSVMLTCSRFAPTSVIVTVTPLTPLV